MSEQLFDKFADLQALEKEKQVVMSLFDEIKKGIEQLSKVGVKIEASKGIRDTSEAIKELQKLEAELLQTEKQLSDRKLQLAEAEKKVAESTKLQTAAINTENNSFRQQVGTIDENIKKREELRSKLSQVRADLKKLRDFDGANQPQLLNEIVKLGKLESELTTQIQYANAAIKTQQKLQLSVNNSLEEAKIKLVELRKERDRQDLNTDTGRSEKERLNAEIDALDALVEHETDLYQKRKINVGNYQGSAKIIVESLKDVEKEISILQQKQQGLVNFSKSNPIGFKVGGGQDSLNQVTAQLGFATKQAEALNNVVANPQFLNISAKAGDAIAETRLFTKTLIDLENQGLKDTDAYRQLQLQLAKLTDTIADTRAEVKALSSDTRGFDLFASSIGTVSSIFQTAASSAELLSGNNEEVQKSIMKLVAIQNISNGVRQIATDLTTRGTAANKAYAFVQNIVATATNASATATARWMALLKGVGVLALISALVFVADKMGIFGSKTEESTDELEKFNTEIAEAKSRLDSFNSSIDATNALNKIKIDIEGGGDVLKLEQDIIATQTKLAELQPTLDKAFKQSIAALVKYQSDASETNKKNAEDTEKTYSELKKTADGYTRFINESSARIDLAKKTANDKEVKEQEAKNKKINEENARQAAAERRAALELQKFRLEIEADAVGSTKDAGPLKGRILAAQTEFELRKKVIDTQTQIELSAEKLNADQRQLILDKAAGDRISLEVQTGADILRIRQDFANAGQDEAQAEADRLIQQENDKVNAKVDASKKAFEKYQQEQEKLAIEGRTRAAEQLKAGTITQEQYNAKIEQINLDHQSRVLQNQIVFAEEQVAILKAAGFDTLQAETEIAKAKEELTLLGVKKIQDATELEKAAIDQLKDKYRELGEAVSNALENVILSSFDARKNQIREQMDLIDELKAKEIERVTATTDTEEKKAAKIKNIEAKAQNDKEALERRQRQIDARRALFERTFKAFQIGTEGIKAAAAVKVSAAETYSRALATTLNPAIAAGLAATVLAQLPIVYATTAANLVGLLATKIPQYWTGTNFSEEGPAFVAERGREIAIEPGGRKVLYEKPTLTELARGTKILSNRVTEDVISAAENERSRMIGAFNQNITVSNNNDVMVERTEQVISELRDLNKKSRIVIINQGNIESTPWYMQHMKY